MHTYGWTACTHMDAHIGRRCMQDTQRVARRNRYTGSNWYDCDMSARITVRPGAFLYLCCHEIIYGRLNCNEFWAVQIIGMWWCWHQRMCVCVYPSIQRHFWGQMLGKYFFFFGTTFKVSLGVDDKSEIELLFVIQCLDVSCSQNTQRRSGCVFDLV